MTHADYMKAALDIAWARIGKTSPNPPVGALIVKEGRVIATGGTGAYGQAHAEASALAAAKQGGESVAGADVYVTLEPCSHYGKTPPCADALLAAGVRRVFIPIIDPNPQVAGRGVEKLRAGGTEVVLLREFSSHAFDIIRPFAKYILHKQPFVLHKSAVTLDGKTATSTGDSKWVSSHTSRYISHRLRALADCIVVGKQTLAADNPALTVRYENFPEEIRGGIDTVVLGKENFFLHKLLSGAEPTLRQPLRVCFGLSPTMDERAAFLANDNYIIFETKQNYEILCKEFPDRNAFWEKLNLVFVNGDNPRAMIVSALDELYKRGVMFVLLEGGAKLAGSFFDAGCIDAAFYFFAPKLIGGGLSSLNGQSPQLMAEALPLAGLSAAQVGEDFILCGYKAEKEEACSQDL